MKERKGFDFKGLFVLFADLSVITFFAGFIIAVSQHLSEELGALPIILKLGYIPGVAFILFKVMEINWFKFSHKSKQTKGGEK